MANARTQKKDEEVIPKLTPNRLKGAEFVRTVYVARVESKVRREHLTEPTFWSHISAQLKSGDKLEVIPDDNSYYAELIVLSARINQANVAMIRFTDFSDEAGVTDDSNTDHPDYDIAYGGNTDKFRVIYKPDYKAISVGHDTKLEAAQWLADYLKTAAK